ncbi:hypothetical protein Tco_1501538 [Tanacetum coccineum]
MIVMTLMPELESLFGPLFDEYLNGENQVVLKSSAVTTADASDKRQQQPDSTSSTLNLATSVTVDGNFDLSYALSWKPCQGDSLNLPDHMYKRRCCSPIPAKSDSLPHAHTQAFKVNHSASRLLILNFLKDLQRVFTDFEVVALRGSTLVQQCHVEHKEEMIYATDRDSEMVKYTFKGNYCSYTSPSTALPNDYDKKGNESMDSGEVLSFYISYRGRLVLIGFGHYQLGEIVGIIL